MRASERAIRSGHAQIEGLDGSALQASTHRVVTADDLPSKSTRRSSTARRWRYDQRHPPLRGRVRVPMPISRRKRGVSSEKARGRESGQDEPSIAPRRREEGEKRDWVLGRHVLAASGRRRKRGSARGKIPTGRPAAGRIKPSEGKPSSAGAAGPFCDAGIKQDRQHAPRQRHRAREDSRRIARTGRKKGGRDAPDERQREHDPQHYII